MKIGDRVEIKRTDIRALQHRKRPWYGVITHIDGGYVDVRPMWCKWETELYVWEIKEEQ